jgi:hypothetical protein
MKNKKLFLLVFITVMLIDSINNFVPFYRDGSWIYKFAIIIFFSVISGIIAKIFIPDKK